MRRATRAAAAAVVLCGAIAHAQAPIPVQAGVLVRPDTVRVGDPFLVSVGIRAPLGATIQFPEAPDTTHRVQGLDPRLVRPGPDTTAVEQYAEYRLAAWDVGAQPIVLGDVLVRVGASERRVPLTGYSVFVQTVLPADTTQREPKPARGLFADRGVPWWVWALLAAAIAAAVAAWWRFRRRAEPRSQQVLVLDPFARAQQEFTRIESLRLVDAGERGRYVALMTEVVREYLAARYPDADLSLTTTEVVAALLDRAGVPHERLRRLLDEADLIKFARLNVSADRARDLGREARAVVDAEREASRPAPVEEVAA